MEIKEVSNIGVMKAGDVIAGIIGLGVVVLVLYFIAKYMFGWI